MITKPFAKLATLRLVDCQSVGELEWAAPSRKIASTIPKTQMRPAGEQDIQPSVVVVAREPNLTIGQIVLVRAFAVIGFPPLVCRLNDLVATYDLLVAEAKPPWFARLLKLLRPELTLNPSVQLVNAVWVHAHRRQDLKVLGAVGVLEGNPALVVESQSGIETANVVWPGEAKMCLERAEQSFAKLGGRAPEQYLQIVEARAEFKVAQNAIRVDSLSLPGEPRGEAQCV